MKHEGDKVLVFERGDLIFIFNFHPTTSFEQYRVPVPTSGSYNVVFNADSIDFGGHNRIDTTLKYPSEDYAMESRQHSVLLYLPSRSAMVIRRQS